MPSNHINKSAKIKINTTQVLNRFIHCYPFFALLGLIAEFLYQWALLWNFSIRVSDYFSLGDYLRSGIIILTITTVVTLLFWIFIFINNSSSKKIKNKYLERFGYYIAYAMVVVILIIGVLTKQPVYILQAILFAVIFIPVGTLVRKYIKNSFQIMTVFILTFIFLTTPLLMAFIEAHDIKDPQNTSDYIEVQLKPKSNLKISNPVKLIAITDQYCLLYDVQNKKVIVISNSNIDYLTKDVH